MDHEVSREEAHPPAGSIRLMKMKREKLHLKDERHSILRSYSPGDNRRKYHRIFTDERIKYGEY
ncbi:YdcH family protein [Salmonella enterica subsp. enterica]|nr:DUF465 domain-containing protein [Salmonella enterica subsp. enterica serovar Enteritidis]EDW1488851.1 YdcH family protein [Salmonella enterica subsp. enterica serovar Hvittingfoss]EEN5589768.1 DUF465 domain-containing protein [Salmonella enterica subsp. enterica serovar Mountpleasant]EIO3280159.1 YdcH family protein [Salmonella enterica]EEH4116809.1 YdcH family protein [Salmonella enterica subsp. enterica serovar Hvittingfoss]